MIIKGTELISHINRDHELCDSMATYNPQASDALINALKCRFYDVAIVQESLQKPLNQEEDIRAFVTRQDELFINIFHEKLSFHLAQHLVSEDGLLLQYFPLALRSNEEMVRAAILQNPFALLYAAEDLQRSVDLVLLSYNNGLNTYLHYLQKFNIDLPFRIIGSDLFFSIEHHTDQNLVLSYGEQINILNVKFKELIGTVTFELSMFWIDSASLEKTIPQMFSFHQLLCAPCLTINETARLSQVLNPEHIQVLLDIRRKRYGDEPLYRFRNDFRDFGAELRRLGFRSTLWQRGGAVVKRKADLIVSNPEPLALSYLKDEAVWFKAALKYGLHWSFENFNDFAQHSISAMNASLQFVLFTGVVVLVGFGFHPYAISLLTLQGITFNPWVASLTTAALLAFFNHFNHITLWNVGLLAVAPFAPEVTLFLVSIKLIWKDSLLRPLFLWCVKSFVSLCQQSQVPLEQKHVDLQTLCEESIVRLELMKSDAAHEKAFLLNILLDIMKDAVEVRGDISELAWVEALYTRYMITHHEVDYHISFYEVAKIHRTKLNQFTITALPDELHFGKFFKPAPTITAHALDNKIKCLNTSNLNTL